MDAETSQKEMEEHIQQLQEGPQTILVRHARSEANDANHEIFNRQGTVEEYAAVAAREDLRDCGICDIGIKECEQAQ